MESDLSIGLCINVNITVKTRYWSTFNQVNFGLLHGAEHGSEEVKGEILEGMHEAVVPEQPPVLERDLHGLLHHQAHHCLEVTMKHIWINMMPSDGMGAYLLPVLARFGLRSPFLKWANQSSHGHAS